MSKLLLIFCFILCISNISSAQQGELEVKGTSSNLYLEHVVTPKENFYSVSRMFNVPPKDIASYNSLQLESGLNVGQTIKIPLSKNNFLQTGRAAASEILVPVHHSVEPKEGLYRVSVNYNNVPLATLKKWNNLQSDEISIGAPLIVGYIKVNREQSTLATRGIVNTSVAAASTVAKTEASKPDITKEAAPPVKNPEIEKKAEVKTAQAVTEQPQQKTETVKTKSNINFSGGYFKQLYNDQLRSKAPVSEAGNAGIFKSTSGWQDGKYYCFNNEALPGTIIKITDNTSGKSVFAKVLDIIPDIKQNEGLAVIISNSAAEELGNSESKFDCALSFAKN
ncbi:MAG: LysM peptidoglycan-binding domain-containing protein [Ginsengibacter sp.]